MKTLVVARCNEDLTWLEHVPEGWTTRVIYKGVDLPDEGREASSYFHALATFAYEPDDLLAFVQGNPFDHAGDLLNTLAHGKFWRRFTPLGHRTVHDDRHGNPNHPGLPIGEKARRWFGVEHDLFEFKPGAQFVIKGRVALTRSREFYAHMQAEMAHEKNPWVMERLWPVAWQGGRNGTT